MTAFSALSSEVGISGIALGTSSRWGGWPPGEMIAVDTAGGRCFSSKDVKAMLASRKAVWRVVLRQNLVRFKHLRGLLRDFEPIQAKLTSSP